MNEVQENARNNLKSGNLELSEVMKNMTLLVVEKAYKIAKDTDDVRELRECINIGESASKITGLSPKESQMNVQINAINGFDFIEIDEEDIKQITVNEEYEEAEIDEEEIGNENNK